MTLDCESKAHLKTIRLDGTFLELSPREEAFFKAETGIQDTEELRKHIIEVQEEAYKVSSRLQAKIRDIYREERRCALCSGLPVSLYSWI